MTDAVVKYEQDGLAIVVHRSRRRALIAWEGVSDARDPALFLNGIIQQLSKELAEFEVTVDFRRLTFMNSATVSPLINLVRSLDASGSGVLVLFSNADWQRTHFQCLKTIARALKQVRVQADAMP